MSPLVRINISDAVMPDPVIPEPEPVEETVVEEAHTGVLVDLMGKHVAITGKLDMGPRRTVQSRIRGVGGYFDDYVAWNTDYLVVGRTGEWGTTNKMRNASSYNTIIMNEADLVASIAYTQAARQTGSRSTRGLTIDDVDIN